MIDLGKYIIRVIEEDRILVRNIDTGRSELLFRMDQIAEFIQADINNDVYISSIFPKKGSKK